MKCAGLTCSSGSGGSTRCSTSRRCWPNQCAKLGPAMNASYSAAAEPKALPASLAVSEGGKPAVFKLARNSSGHQCGTCKQECDRCNSVVFAVSKAYIDGAVLESERQQQYVACQCSCHGKRQASCLQAG
jgi:hypothetical protein